MAFGRWLLSKVQKRRDGTVDARGVGYSLNNQSAKI